MHVMPTDISVLVIQFRKKNLGYTVGEKFIETRQGEIYMKTKSMIQQRMK